MKLMKLLVVGSLLVLGGLGIGVGASSAAPTNSDKSAVVAADCGADGVIDILVTAGGGSPAFEIPGSNGRTYETSLLEGRAYVGKLDSEPTASPVFAFVKGYGKRNGFTRSLTCAAHGEMTMDGTVYTWFYDVTLAAK